MLLLPSFASAVSGRVQGCGEGDYLPGDRQIARGVVSLMKKDDV